MPKSPLTRLPLAAGVAATIGLSTAVATAAHADPFQVRVVGIDRAAGDILVALCRRDEYPDGPCAIRGVTPAQRPEATIRFADVAPGTYAVQVLQDLDGDRRLKRGLFGMPREPIGFGNDAEPRGGPPEFEAAAVRVDDGHAIVTLRSH